MATRIALAVSALIIVIVIGAGTLIQTTRLAKSAEGLHSVLDQQAAALNQQAARLASVQAAQARSDLTLAELRAVVDLPADKARAEKALVEYAKMSANQAGLVPPSESEIETKKPDQRAMEENNKKVESAAEGLANSSESNCTALIESLKDVPTSDKIKTLAESGNLTKMKECKQQLDEHLAQLKREYAAMHCDQKPQADGCEQKKREIDRASSADDFIRILMVAAALYLIVTGSPELGFPLLMMANARGAEGSEGSKPSDDGVKTADPNRPPASVPTADKGGNWGNGGTLICDREEATITCTQDGFTETIDPAQHLEANLQEEGRQNIADALREAIVSNRVNDVALCTKTSPGHDFLSGIVFHDQQLYYLISIQYDGKRAKLIYPPKSGGKSDRPDCGQIAK